MKRKVLFCALLLLAALFALAHAEPCSHKWVYTKTDDATHKRTCTKCSVSEQVSHSFTTTRSPATCAKSGTVTMVCSACGYSTSREDGAPTGKHTWGADTAVTEASCSTEGSRTHTCTVCGKTETVVTPKLNHTFGSYSKNGDSRHSRTCSVCGYTQTENHETAIAKVITAARSNRLGKKNITCAKCGASFMRFNSIYETLYEMKGTDILNNGTSYIKVNTVTLTGGNSRDLTLYTGGTVALTATSNSKTEIYASAKTGEYTGIWQMSGGALLTVSGDNAIEFLSAASGSSITLMLNENASLRLGSREGKTILIRRIPAGCAVIDMLSSGGTITGTASCYAGDRLYVSGSGDNIKLSGNGAPLCSADLGYNSRTSAVSARGNDAATGISVLDADGNTVLSSENGILKGSLDTAPLAFRLSGSFGSFGTPMIDGSAVMGSDTPAYEPEDGEPDAPVVPEGDDTPREIPSVIGPGTVLNERTSESPAVEVRVENGVYTVTVTAVPSGCTFESITFIQNYVFPGQRRLISYSADASFPIENTDSTVSAVVTLKKGGKTVTYPAGRYDYKAQ